MTRNVAYFPMPGCGRGIAAENAMSWEKADAVPMSETASERDRRRNIRSGDTEHRDRASIINPGKMRLV